MPSTRAPTGLAAAICAAVGLASGAAADVAFRHTLDNSPLDVTPWPGERVTNAAKEFLSTGNNPYRGQEQALADGKKLYAANCQACHLPDGKGRIGPSLVGDKWVHERAATDAGMFEVIYGGASGAMQSFARRGMAIDDMLKIIAYVRSLKKT